MSETETCPRVGRLFGGCRFSGRFDLGTPSNTSWRGDAAAVLGAIEACKPKTYVRDVCERCGKTIERQK